MSFLLRTARRLIRKPLMPRQFPATGFEVIDSSRLVEEETWEWYKPEEFYPVRIGDIFKSQYQIVGKLGYGAHGTAWLCRDLLDHKHVTLKIGTPEALKGELKVLRHLTTIKTNHAGSLLIRQMLDEFDIDSKNGVFHCMVHPPLAISLKAFRRTFPERALPVVLVKLVLKHILIALDFLHTTAKVVHTGKPGKCRTDARFLFIKDLERGHSLNEPTDIQESNILLEMNEETAEQDLNTFEKEEQDSPSARKFDGDRVVHTSRRLVPPIYRYGRPVLCDFGEARFGEYDNMVDIQPYQYRAPEVILEVPWDEKVDIWGVGVTMWDLLGNGNLFCTTGGPEDKQDNIYHLAHMIALLGPPPKGFLERTKGDRVCEWFDENGSWRGAAEVPSRTWEEAERRVEGKEKAMCLDFAKKMLKWKPEERSSAKELLKDAWLNSALV